MRESVLESEHLKTSLTQKLGEESCSTQELKKLASGEDIFKEQKVDKSLFIAQQGMDKTNKVDSFEMIGWSHPDQADSRKAVKWLKNL